ncbi:hypothetical protein CEXT_271431 [Caerostris extrusa]|uniref:Uncharacterized protein n=1 Tax=Caerostris extrusa TaxID=172846 RepID=A0AAV4U214_CAEEX|nr:hypothetical protein CEXT_271431 [Caerostris extrusa]
MKVKQRINVTNLPSPKMPLEPRCKQSNRSFSTGSVALASRRVALARIKFSFLVCADIGRYMIHILGLIIKIVKLDHKTK